MCRKWLQSARLSAICLLVLTSLAYSATVKAQSGPEPIPQWIRFTTDDGLPGKVWDLGVFPDGSVWFAGDDGVTIYNGTQWTTLVAGDGISDVWDDAAGNVWVMAWQDPNPPDCWVDYGEPCEYPFSTINFYETSTQKLTSRQIECYDFVQDTQDLWSDSTDTLWLRWELWRHWAEVCELGDVQTGNPLGPSPEDGISVETAWADGADSIWIGADGGRLWHFDGQTWTSIALQAEPPPERIRLIRSWGGLDTPLWLSTDVGLIRVQVGSGVQQIYTEADGLPLTDVRDLAYNTSGDLWVATPGGIASYTPSSGLWRSYPTDEAVTAIAAAQPGRVWLVLEGGDVLLLDLQSWQKLVPPGLEDAGITASWADPEGNLWVGMGNGLAHYDAGTGTWRSFHSPDLPSNHVTDLWQSDAGRLWVATDGGLARYDPLDGRWTHYGVQQGLEEKVIYGVQGYRDLVWVLNRQGLFQYDAGANHWALLPGCGGGDYGADPVDILHVDAAGRLWTLEWGTRVGVTVCRFDGEAAGWQRYELYSPSGAFQRYALVGDAEGGVLFASTAGIARYNPQQNDFEWLQPPGQTWASDRTSMFDMPASALDTSGTLWAGSRRYDLTVYAPATVPDPGQLTYRAADIFPDEPGGQVQRVQFIGDQGLFVTGAALYHYTPSLPKVYLDELSFPDGKTQICGEQQVKLPFTRNNPIFTFLAGSLETNGAGTRYRYRLWQEGDPPPDWRFLRNPSLVTKRAQVPFYEGLAPGRYTFEVAVGDAHLNWSSPAACFFHLLSRPPQASILALSLDDRTYFDTQLVPEDVDALVKDMQLVARFGGTDDGPTGLPAGYEYRIAGLDSDWVRASSDVVTRTLSAPGVYTLTVQAVDADGQPSEPVTSKIQLNELSPPSVSHRQGPDYDYEIHLADSGRVKLILEVYRPARNAWVTAESRDVTRGGRYTFRVRPFGLLDWLVDISPLNRPPRFRFVVDDGQSRLTFPEADGPPHVAFAFEYVQGLVIVALVALAIGGSLLIYRAWRASGRYPYHDVLVTILPAERPDQVRVHLDARRITLLPAYGPLSHLTRWLPPVGRPRRLPLPENDPVDLTRLAEIKGMAPQLRNDPGDTERLRFMGARLYQTLFTAETTDVLRRHLGLGQQGLRLRLPFAGHRELAGLPWELLHGGQNMGFLGQKANTLLVRYVEPKPDQDWKRPRIRGQLRVLAVMAQPGEPDVAPLGLEYEKAYLDSVEKAIQQVNVGYLYGVHAAQLVEEKAVAEDLTKQLGKRLEEGWDVLHFVGHAGPDRLAETPAQAEVVLWCEDRRGDYLAVGADELGRLLGGLAGEGKVPKLVVLNACDTASIESDLLQAILDSGVGAVIGMQWPVLDVAAQAFAENFYRTLGRYGRVDYALGIARNRMARELHKAGKGRHDWAAPVLVMQTEDGVIFERA